MFCTRKLSQDLAFVNKPHRVFGPEKCNICLLHFWISAESEHFYCLAVGRKNLFRQKVPPGSPGADSLPGYLTDLDQRPSGHQLTSPDLWVQVMWGSERVNQKKKPPEKTLEQLAEIRKKESCYHDPPFTSLIFICVIDWCTFKRAKEKTLFCYFFFSPYTHIHTYIYIYSIAFYFVTCINLGPCQWQQVVELGSLVGLYQRRAHEPSVINDSQSQWLHSFLGR